MILFLFCFALRHNGIFRWAIFNRFRGILSLDRQKPVASQGVGSDAILGVNAETGSKFFAFTYLCVMNTCYVSFFRCLLVVTLHFSCEICVHCDFKTVLIALVLVC